MDKNGNRIGPRRTVGPADPATRRRELDKRLSEREPAPPARQKRQPTTDNTQMGVSPNTARLLRDRGKQIDAEVDKRSK